MFTGIIRYLGTITHIDHTDRDVRFTITAPDMMRHRVFDLGASIASNGVCLTLVDQGPDWYAVEVSNETLAVTTMRNWTVGMIVNLEPSMKIGDELGGHLVSGHVDGVTDIVSITPDGGSHRIRLRIPTAHAGFIAGKGSIALDGISLTVNDIDDKGHSGEGRDLETSGPPPTPGQQFGSFGINIIPHTWDYTNFHTLKPGDQMNYEIDVMARYAARLMESRIV